MKKGFSLIELLIVIAIIGVLSSIAVASYTTTQKKSRDSRRSTDMKAIQNAWEQYYADNSSNYPAGCTFSATPTPGVMSGKYLPGGFPVDPRSGTPYPSMSSGWSQCASTAYCFCAGVEVASSANGTVDCGGSSPTGYSGMYCVRSVQ